jgi:ATP-dependent exoDNAse (exonuclease V) beta subunit
MPLVAISPTKKILQTHFKNDYIQEALSQYIDNLNLTYVAFTRPKYRLYAYGQMYSKNSKGELKINNIGNLLSYLYHKEGEDNTSSQETQNEEGTFIYHQATTTIAQPKAKEPTINTREATYISSPIGNRLKLRSRAEDDFAEETPLETIDLGILMHEFLAAITTWADADNALQRMLLEGRITAAQQVVLQQQLQELQTLLQKEGKEWWFTQPCKVLNEHDILTTTGNTQRPDRVIIHQGTAIIIDYKLGQEHKKQYQEQLRNYALLLQQMGYTTESYIVYVAQQKIEQVQ